ncbi:hypothetical protein [Endobacterium cereale]|jgi:hypothetical protein|nr:hypothetical protein [Endobacterium cereale]MEB2843233.1 hypothetical protein [Endobacterium cereale]
MTFMAAFYLYIIPGATVVIGLAWIMFDKQQERRSKRLHPGE